MNPQKQKSKRQEKRVAKKVDGRTTVASGAVPFDKGDVSSESFLIECKTTDKKSYSLKNEIFEKIAREAVNVGKIPLMAIEINGAEYIVCRDYDFFSIIKEEFI